MNMVLKIFLSMSVSGGLLILFLLLGKYFLQNKISRQWQYYIWLIVVLRLLLPFGPETNLMGQTYQAVDQAITQGVSSPQHKPIQNTPVQSTPGGTFTPAVGTEADNENVNSPTESLIAAHPIQDIWTLFINHIWLVWLVVALGLLIQKMTIYQGFMRYINAGLIPVSDMEKLDQLSIVAEQTGVKKPIELCVNPMVSSPLLIGLFRPCIVLPSMDISEKDFRYIVLHELTHYKRRDMFYKWLVQITVCLHWFNPLVHLMSREITKACEFSCDEAVLTQMGYDNAQDYGKTLLDAMGAIGKYKENLGAVTLSENKQLLKERLGAIMNFKRKSAAIRFLTGVLTLCVMFSAAFVGVYPVAAAADHSADKPITTGNENSAHAETNTRARDYAAQAEQYYEADSLPLFQITFSRLDENTQKVWLERLYADGDFAFFSVAVRSLNADSPLLSSYAEKAYADSEIAFFSTLTDCMDRAELELWLDRALEDGRWNFQSMLFDKLDMEEEKDAQEKEWAEQQMAEYRAVGVTKDGKNYYYQGKLVNIFLDSRPNKSVYTLDVNPAGTVNIKIIRNESGQITGVAYMTEAEVKELLDDMYDPDDDLLEMETLELKGTTYFLVANEAQLRAIGTGKYGMNQNYMQQADIYLSANEWVPIGTWDHPFTGSFNGNGFEIIGLTMKDPDTKIIGLFGVAKNAHIYNVTMRNYDIMSAGRNVSGKSVGAVLAIGQGSQSYDNFLYPKTVNYDIPEETWDDSESVSIPVDIAKVKGGEYIWLGTYTLAEGDRVFYDVSAESGKQLDVGFAKPGQERPNPTYNTISNLRQENEKLEVKSGAIVWGVKSGKYSLFIHTEGGTLTGVTGYVTIIKANAD